MAFVNNFYLFLQFKLRGLNGVNGIKGFKGGAEKNITKWVLKN